MSTDGLAMPIDEIVVRYRQAKDRNDQVRKLAELNAVPVERIISILIGAGFDHRCFSNLRRKMNAEERAILEQAEKAELTASAEKKPRAAEVAEKMQGVLYAKKIPLEQEIERALNENSVIISKPTEQFAFPTFQQALATLKTQIAEIKQQQYELDMKKANLVSILKDLLKEVE